MAGITVYRLEGTQSGQHPGALVGELGSGKKEGPEVQRSRKRLHIGGTTDSDFQWHPNKLAKRS